MPARLYLYLRGPIAAERVICMDNNNILLKEIDLIQCCITRMGQNSFNIKGWTIAFIVAVIALMPEEINSIAICLLLIAPTVLFWALDAFYLRTEKLYRWKYEWVIKNRQRSNDFCYDLNPYNEAMWLLGENGTPKAKPTITRIMFTKTLLPFYLPVILISVCIAVIALISQMC